MPAYEFKCVEHGVFEREFTFAEFDELKRNKDGEVVVKCVSCKKLAPKIFSTWGSISTSDDPSRSCTPGKSDYQRGNANREVNSFGDFDFNGWAERPQHDKRSWEYAD